MRGAAGRADRRGATDRRTGFEAGIDIAGRSAIDAALGRDGPGDDAFTLGPALSGIRSDVGLADGLIA